jgi:asparagine synthetase A
LITAQFVYALATAIAIEIGGQLEDFKLMIKNELIEEVKSGFKNQEASQDNRLEELKDFIAVSVREGVQDELSNLKAHVDNRELEARKRDEEMIDTLKKSMEEQKKLNEQKNKGFFSKLFNK